jgi:hypothetical protein
MYRKSLWLVTLAFAPLLFGSLLNARTLQEQNTSEKTQPSPKPKDGLDKKRSSTRAAGAGDIEKGSKAAAKDTGKAAKQTGSMKKANKSDKSKRKRLIKRRISRSLFRRAPHPSRFSKGGDSILLVFLHSLKLIDLDRTLRKSRRDL